MIKIYGKNCVKEALRTHRVRTLYLTEAQKKKEEKFLRETAKDVDLKICSSQELDRKFGIWHQGFAAEREDFEIDGEEELLNLIHRQAPERILLLAGITDPQNLGAILRSADAFGFDVVVLPKNRSCMVNSTVVHVSTGAIEYVRIGVVNSLYAFTENLKKENYWIVAADAQGTTDVSQIRRDVNLAVIIGSEGFGISKTLLRSADYVVKISMVGHVNSLNASVSAGILLHAFSEKGTK